MPPLSCAGGGTTLPLSPFPKPLPDWRCTAPPLLNWPGGGTTAPSPNPPIARCSSEPPPNYAAVQRWRGHYFVALDIWTRRNHVCEQAWGILKFVALYIRARRNNRRIK